MPLHSEKTVLQIIAQLLWFTMPNGSSTFNNHATIGNGEKLRQGFIDNKKGLTPMFQFLNRFPDFLTDDGRKPLCCLVENQKLRIGHQCTSDRQHLLFAA